jgi:hypothetical protein
MTRPSVCSHLRSAAGLLLLLGAAAPAATIRVPGGADTIQEALDAAAAGDTVLVAPGEYVVTEPIEFNRLLLPKGTGSPPGKNLTLRSEAGPEQTVLRMAASPADTTRASVVFFGNRETPASVLEGFTITGGTGTVRVDGVEWDAGGGGILCFFESTPTVRNCRVVENGPALRGGGICCFGASPIIVDCLITRNSACQGGGMACYGDARPQVITCTFSENSALLCEPAPFPAGGGGGLASVVDGAPSIVECRFEENSAVVGGGLFCADEGGWEMARSTVVGNRASAGGGGIASTGISVPVSLNCVIAANYGSGVFLDASGGEFWNCTFAGNADSGVRLGEAAWCRLNNSIVWHNGGDAIDADAQSAATVSHCCIEGGWNGEAVIAGDPRFVEIGSWDLNGTPEDLSDDGWTEGDFRLQASSPCIDTGTCQGAPVDDRDGNGRPAGSSCDMGAYESGGEPLLRFLRGETNDDGNRNIADAVFILANLFAGGAPLACRDAADANDDGDVNIADAVAILSHLFAATGPLPEPFLGCGLDPTSDELDCAAFAGCR